MYYPRVLILNFLTLEDPLYHSLIPLEGFHGAGVAVRLRYHKIRATDAPGGVIEVVSPNCTWRTPRPMITLTIV